VNVVADPAVSLRGRDFLSVADLSVAEVGRVFDRAGELKAEYRTARRHLDPPLAGRTIAMLFQRPSLRTRVTFEAGMNQLGGHAIYLTEDVVMGARESVRDVARNLERFVDAIVARTGPHAVVTELAAQAAIPVINALTLREHPCQALADIFTLRER
jgi:ornithine carbamoyltransferase